MQPTIAPKQPASWWQSAGLAGQLLPVFVRYQQTSSQGSKVADGWARATHVSDQTGNLDANVKIKSASTLSAFTV